ncbi:MAG: hypothetical protein IH608_11245, partial [Proteobacteria bacterium]|nr:hypothetical protein [Pseudomonadota bacterium]
MSPGVKRAALGLGAALAVLAALLAVAAAAVVYRPGLLRPLAEGLLRPPGGTSSLAGVEVGLRPPLLVLRGLDVRWAGSEDRLRLERLLALPIPGRILGDGPWLRRVEVQGLELRRHALGAGTGGPPDLSPLSWVFAVENLSVQGSGLDLDIGGTAVNLEGLSLSLVPVAAGRELTLDADVSLREPGGGATRGRVRGAGTMTPGPGLALRLDVAAPGLELGALGGDLEASAQLALSQELLEVHNLELTLSGAHLSAPSGEPWELGTGRATLAGEVGLDGTDPHLALSRLEVGDLLRGRGSLSGRTLSALTGSLQGTLPEFRRLRPGLAPLLPASLRDLDLRGELPFRLESTASEEGPSLSVELRPGELTLSWPGQGLTARLGGTLGIRAPLSGWARAWRGVSLEGRLEAVADLVRPPLAVRSVRLAVPLSGSLSAFWSRE